MSNPPFLSDTTAPYARFAAITTADTGTIPLTRAIYVGVTGDVTALDANGNSILFKAMPVGFYAVAVSQVKATGTTATNLVACY